MTRPGFDSRRGYHTSHTMIRKLNPYDKLSVKMLEDTRDDVVADDVDPLAGIDALTMTLDGCPTVKAVALTALEHAALREVLLREATSRPIHDGLRGLLSLSHDHAEALLGLLRRVF